MYTVQGYTIEQVRDAATVERLQSLARKVGEDDTNKTALGVLFWDFVFYLEDQPAPDLDGAWQEFEKEQCAQYKSRG